MPERFLEDLQQLPATAGIALGIDRLLMLLVGERQINKVVPFAPDDF
jgi:lysyl-tRNA synthetase class 2